MLEYVYIIHFSSNCAYFSESPSHFEIKSDDVTDKNDALLASVATAFANCVLPVPGGYSTLKSHTLKITPNNKIPLHGLLVPVNNWGNFDGKIAASWSDCFAASKPAISSHFISSFSCKIDPI